MNFYTVRDLRTTPKSIWENLSADGEVIITNNGRPTAILFDIADGSFEETVKAVRQAKAMIAFNSMRAKAAANGYMSDEDIEAEIAAVRRGELSLMLVVIDTNILVSALWSRNGAPARVVSMVLTGDIVPCYDYRILCEYREVLQRPKFGFSKSEINSLLDWFEACGRSVLAEPLEDVFVDEADKKFYEVAKFCGAVLVTGNLKHFPEDPLVMSVADFLEKRRS